MEAIMEWLVVVVAVYLYTYILNLKILKHVFILNKSCFLKDFRLKKTIKDAQISLHVVFHVNLADIKDVLMLECQWN